MIKGNCNEIWTIGHSTRTIDDFIRILKAYNIEMLADVRSYPGSKRFPQFNKNKLCIILAKENIEYLHIAELGGRLTTNINPQNSFSKNSTFNTYLRYMETEPFMRGIKLLINISRIKRTAIMCSEASWKKCHRSMISDYLKSKHIEVNHLIDKSGTETHIFTKSRLSIQEELEFR
jgi:uncharacterized protein (DUF488 family)